MATYATKTNPFLKGEATNGTTGRCGIKDAPGMAKPQTFISDQSNTVLTDVLIGDQDAEHTTDNTEKKLEKIVEADVESKINSGDDLNHFPSSCLDENQNNIIGKELGSKENAYLDVNENVVQDLVGISEINFVESTTNVASKKEDLKVDKEEEEEVDEESPPLQSKENDSRRQQHIELIKKLRLQLRDLERYAYERGELEQVPPSVIAERQTVILDTLKDKLSLNICMDELEKLQLDDLKKQVDKEITNLIDPLISKEQLLGQLQTQLIDLERYISHLHGTLDKRACQCQVHGCSSDSAHYVGDSHTPAMQKGFPVDNNNSLPRTSNLIRTLVTQLICSDIKLQESAKKEKENEEKLQKHFGDQIDTKECVKEQPKFNDGAWSLHLDKVILATDSLMNLFFLEPQYQSPKDKPVDKGLVESVVRRQLVPAIRDLLSYGLVDPNSTARPSSYTSMLFDPYYLLTSLTCFPGSNSSSTTTDRPNAKDRMHVWCIIEDYYESRNELGFKNSSIKTLSQSFNLEPSVNGPIKITSKQALLIAVDDIIETLSKCKPDGPESHFRAFIYSALNRSKLSTWLRLVFRNKSVVRKYYHSYSFVSQEDKMDKFLKTIEPLSRIQFNLSTDIDSIEQFISAF